MRTEARAQRGQALVEALVAAIALVPLALLVVLLGKFQSMQQATIAASRTLAFECSVRPDDCSDAHARAALAEDARRRHFGRIDREVFSADVLDDGAPVQERNALWTDRRMRPLLERYADVSIAVTPSRFDAGRSTAIGRAAGDAGQLLDRLAGPSRFGLSLDGGLAISELWMRVSPSQAGNEKLDRLDSLPLLMHARVALVTDAWNASGPYGAEPHSVQSRVQAGQQVDPVHEAAFGLGYQLTLWSMQLMDVAGLEPRASDFHPHQADVDRVPVDRIGR
ncbi:MAG: hypothetical protein LT106_01745 [Burkholderiaceae bacterium]|nr:hypothetical protein [Burkholderiaceae bacterium]